MAGETSSRPAAHRSRSRSFQPCPARRLRSRSRATGRPRRCPAGRGGARSWPSLGAFVLTAIGALVVDLPAVAFGVKVTSSHTPPGLTIADTFVQDLAFVAAPLLCARRFSGAVRSWQFGLRRAGLWLGVGRADGARPGDRVPDPERDLVDAGQPRQGETARTARHRREHAAARAQCRADVRGGADVRGVPVPRVHLHRAAHRGACCPRRSRTGCCSAACMPARRRRSTLLPLAALGFGLCLLYPLQRLAVSGDRRPCAQQLARLRQPRGLDVVGRPRADRGLAARRHGGDRGLQARRPDRPRDAREGSSRTPRPAA